MSSQLEQLLTCCICLDRYRNPKLLPCQHSVCMEPCMEGLVDYVRRQVKCPECRAEHRIPYNGVQGFPSNVTLQRFLEAHIEITGEVPDPFTGQIMERCGVCNEKNYLSTCAHCEKKICVDCKAAHTEILKREIGRINNQVRRAFHRLGDQLSIVERNITALKHNSDNVTEEMDNISKRLQKAIRDRSDFLRNEVMSYYNTELRNLTLLKEGLEQEISNVESNMDLADKHMDDQTSWDDAELMDTKDIFLRTMEFIRSFDYEAGDYNRRAKFSAPDDINKLAASLSTLGELIISNPKQTIDTYGSGSSALPSSGLMKSKSDHRLAVQFRDQEESFGSGRTSPVSRRRFGDRLHIHEDSAADSQRDGRHRFRSRFMRKEEEEERPTRYDEEPAKTRQRVIDSEDVSRGPLSGILRMADSPRVIERLQERDRNIKKKKEEPPKPLTPVSQAPKPVTFGTPRKTARQASNDDEIDKIKKQNKSEATSSSASATPAKPALERLTSLKDTERSSRADRNSASPRSITHSPSNTEEETTSTSRYRDYSNGANSTPSAVTRKTSTETPPTSQRTYPFSPSSSTSSVGEGGRSAGSKVSVKPTENSSFERRLSRSNSTESNKSNDGASSPRTGAAFSTDELRNRFQKTNDTKSSSSTTPSTRSSAGGSSRFQSRFLARSGTPSVEASKESGNEDDDEESSEESDSEESEETSDEEEEKEDVPLYSRSDGGTHAGRSTRDSARKEANNHSSSSNTSANDSGYGSSNNSRSVAPSSTNSIDVQSHRRPSYLESSRLAAAKEKEREDEFESKYPYASKFLNRSKTSEEDVKTPFQSRFLNKSKSSALLGPDALTNDDDSHSPSTIGSSSRAKFEELKEKRQRLARSKSSAGMDEEETTPEPPTTSYRSRYGRDNETPAPSTPSSRLTSTPEDSNAPANQLSNWAKYLKNKYGNKTGTGATTSSSGIGNSIGATASSSSGASSSALSSRSQTSPSSRAIARSRSSHLLGFGKDDSSEDDSKNVGATPTSPVVVGTLGPTPFGNLHRSQTLHEQQLLFKIGSRGSEPGSFTWPRGIAIGPDDSIVVADSSNHRVQVFDKEGNYVKYFGSYGNGEGEFDCLSGVAVNRSGQFIIADRYNHRVQIFDPSGSFLRSFGCQGSGDGKFSYPWGVTTDVLEFIYVCDKENHRIQVFQSDGTFVGKFGTIGNKPGQLEHPHYIAVSSTNRVIVSDSNNHRIQIFDTNGKLMSTFGSEGSDEGQFKFPRGVAVDEQGSIYVADSGNNRIQLFEADGSFRKCFGCWGSNDGEFKGLEGVAVMSNGNILICDRENHRVQVF